MGVPEGHEGGNLGLTQAARIEYSLGGGSLSECGLCRVGRFAVPAGRRRASRQYVDPRPRQR